MNFVIKLSTALLIALTLTACGGGGKSGNNSGNTNTPSSNTTNGNNTNNNQTNSTDTNSSTGNNTDNNQTNGNSSTGNTTDNNQTNGNNTNNNQTNSTDTNSSTNETNPYAYGFDCKGEIVYGHQLPPCPDPEENSKTLLGIDTNNNGVRDDVERWIYHTYDTYIPCIKQQVNITMSNGAVAEVFKDICETESVPYHQIVREIAMQYARAYQIVIQEPEKARETTQYVDNAQDCKFYFQDGATYFGEPILINDYELYKAIRNIQFNTIERAKAYSQYNFYLGGGIYGSTPYKEERAKCDFDVDKLLGK